MLEGTGARIEDSFIKKAAEGADEARKNFDGMTESLMKLTGATKEFIGETAGAAGALTATAEQRRKNMPKASSTAIVGPILQPQAGKPKGP